MRKVNKKKMSRNAVTTVEWRQGKVSGEKTISDKQYNFVLDSTRNTTGKRLGTAIMYDRQVNA